MINRFGMRIWMMEQNAKRTDQLMMKTWMGKNEMMIRLEMMLFFIFILFLIRHQSGSGLLFVHALNSCLFKKDEGW